MEEQDLRIGDVDRESALSALGEHMSAGRLDIDEYGERSAKVATAKTRGDLVALFSDLPAPGPTFSLPGASPARTMDVPAVVDTPSAQPPATRPGSTVGERLVGALVPLSGIIALVLFLTVVNSWLVFLIPAAVAVVGGALVGDQHRNLHRNLQRHQRHQMRHQMRYERRQLRRGYDDCR